MLKIEISKEESINGRWKWRVVDGDGSSWNNSEKGLAWIASGEGERTINEIEKTLQILSDAVAKGS
jgi:hypothetical protein